MVQRGENRRSLGERLRVLRKENGVQGPHALAELLNRKYSVSGILKRERGEIKIDLEYIRDFCTALRLERNEKRKLLGLAELHLGRFDAWRQAGKSTVQLHSEFMQRLQCAEWFAAYEPMLVHGLLQTEDYAYEILRLFGHDDKTSREGAMSRTDLLKTLRAESDQVGKQRVFARLVLHESALMERIGSPATMRQQLEYLSSLSSSLSNSIQLRILPVGIAVRAPIAFSFNLFDTTSATMETLAGAVHATDVATTEWLEGVFSTIWDNAVYGKACAEIFTRALAAHQR